MAMPVTAELAARGHPRGPGPHARSLSSSGRPSPPGEAERGEVDTVTGRWEHPASDTGGEELARYRVADSCHRHLALDRSMKKCKRWDLVRKMDQPRGKGMHSRGLPSVGEAAARERASRGARAQRPLQVGERTNRVDGVGGHLEVVGSARPLDRGERILRVPDPHLDADLGQFRLDLLRDRSGRIPYKDGSSAPAMHEGSRLLQIG